MKSPNLQAGYFPVHMASSISLMDWGQDTGCVWRPIMEKRVISLREWLGIKRRAVKETEDRGSSILLMWAPALRVMSELD